MNVGGAARPAAPSYAVGIGGRAALAPPPHVKVAGTSSDGLCAHCQTPLGEWSSAEPAQPPLPHDWLPRNYSEIVESVLGKPAHDDRGKYAGDESCALCEKAVHARSDDVCAASKGGKSGRRCDHGITVYCCLNVRSLDEIDTKLQTWRGDVVVELLCVGNLKAKLAPRARADTASSMDADGASAVPAHEWQVQIPCDFAPGEAMWVPFPQELQRSASRVDNLQDDLLHDTFNNKLKGLVNYSFENLIEDTSRREKWVTVHNFDALKVDAAAPGVSGGEEHSLVRCAFSICERVRGRFGQRFYLKSYPFDTQRLRVEIKTVRASQFTFGAATHVAADQPAWTKGPLHGVGSESLLGDASTVKEKFFDEATKAMVPRLWPWLAIVGISTNDKDHPPPAGNCVVLKPKNSALYAEWEVFEVVESKTRRTLAKESRSGAVYDMHILKIVVARRPKRMLWSLIGPTFLIATSAFAVVPLPPDDASSRLQVIVALLVSLVLLHKDTSSEFEELTLVARYSSYCLVMLLLAMLEVAIAKWHVTGSMIREASVMDKWTELPHADGLHFDWVCWSVLAALWTAVNLVFAGHAAILLHRRRLRKDRDRVREDHHRAVAKEIKERTPLPDVSVAAARTTSAPSVLVSSSRSVGSSDASR